MGNTLDNYLGLQQAALKVREQRQQVLASNIANADTPNYKARDIDFKQALNHAMSPNSVPQTTLKMTNPAHLPGTNTGMTTSDGTPILYRMPAQASADANTVEMDNERAQFADNALHYEASITMVTGQIKQLLSVIQG